MGGGGGAADPVRKAAVHAGGGAAVCCAAGGGVLCRLRLLRPGRGVQGGDRAAVRMAGGIGGGRRGGRGCACGGGISAGAFGQRRHAAFLSAADRRPAIFAVVFGRERLFVRARLSGGRAACPRGADGQGGVPPPDGLRLHGRGRLHHARDGKRAGTAAGGVHLAVHLLFRQAARIPRRLFFFF